MAPSPPLDSSSAGSGNGRSWLAAAAPGPASIHTHSIPCGQRGRTGFGRLAGVQGKAVPASLPPAMAGRGLQVSHLLLPDRKGGHAAALAAAGRRLLLRRVGLRDPGAAAVAAKLPAVVAALKVAAARLNAPFGQRHQPVGAAVLQSTPLLAGGMVPAAEGRGHELGSERVAHTEVGGLDAAARRIHSQPAQPVTSQPALPFVCRPASGSLLRSPHNQAPSQHCVGSGLGSVQVGYRGQRVPLLLPVELIIRRLCLAAAAGGHGAWHVGYRGGAPEPHQMVRRGGPVGSPLELHLPRWCHCRCSHTAQPGCSGRPARWYSCQGGAYRRR